MKVFKSLYVCVMMMVASSGNNNNLLLLPLVEGSVAGGAALKALKSMDYRYFVAGGTCAAFSHGITCPIDVVKVRRRPKKTTGTSPSTDYFASHDVFPKFFLSSSLFFSQTRIQANPKVYDKGLVDATLSICKTDGPQVLVGGLGPTVAGRYPYIMLCIVLSTTIVFFSMKDPFDKINKRILFLLFFRDIS